MPQVVVRASVRDLVAGPLAEECRRVDAEVAEVAEVSRLLGMDTEMVRESSTGSGRMGSVTEQGRDSAMQHERKDLARRRAHMDWERRLFHMGSEMVLCCNIAATAALESATYSDHMLALASRTLVALAIGLVRLVCHPAKAMHDLESTQRSLLVVLAWLVLEGTGEIPGADAATEL